ncbi:undecaprenyl-phosphate glucose phosphotransferase [Mucilaginibacter terrenus]|uniref:Undecaprenyl-phosphate glucose phosphotransferase n=1 Tax=Mucilaginibacter terrenus TaxID=2482727 RepID=A0A3E2NY36_9SPHI|nr:undecaprenyl-phosphate glucose phosphotransferase [Mucilaginibacter terrenus]RFZ85770.1 undecaprenyl-phosphate glucose phosphotransferase [Mucilaginibacter terrenus]
MELRYKYRFNFFRFINEVILLTISFVLSFYILNRVYHRDFIMINIWMLPLLVIGWYFSSRSTKSSDDFNSKSYTATLYKIANSIFVQFCLVILFFFTSHQTYNTKRFLLFYIILLGILVPLEKLLYKKTLLYLHKKGVNRKRILIVGGGRTGMQFSDIITKNDHLGYEIIGFLDDEKKSHLNGQYLGPTSKIDEYLASGTPEFDEVVVALPNSAHNKIKHIASVVGRNTIKLRIIPAYHELINSQYNVSIFNGFPMITLRHEPLDELHLRVIKRLFDIVFSFLVLILVCSWLFPLIALAIKLTSKGPIFFVQERWGKKNRKIKCYKFRSMYVRSRDVDEVSGKYQQAKKNDPRITKIGGFLRKSNLDEFPQFFNVFFGDMSVVGPRPHPTPLNLESKELIDNYLVRHLVKPGITGWAQVNGFRGETSDPSLMKARVNYDIWYIENWSLLLDLKIIFLTFWKTIVGDKNAF